jgi:transglutaminase-like putative cysteine protease
VPEFRITHLTRYTYPSKVHDSANQLRLYPVTDTWQNVTDYSLKITGEPVIESHRDYFGNLVQTFTLTEPHEMLEIESAFSVITTPRPAPAGNALVQESIPLTDISDLVLLDYLRSPVVNGLNGFEEMMQELKQGITSVLGLAQKFSDHIYNHFRYIRGVTNVNSTLQEVWNLRAGVCQDFAHLLLEMLRYAGIPARYVSGYICPEDSSTRGIGATHAWVDVFLHGYGWVGIDPTNNCIADTHHVRIATGRNFNDCSPVKGTYRGTSDHGLEVIVNVAGSDASGTTLESADGAAPFVNLQQQVQQQQ